MGKWTERVLVLLALIIVAFGSVQTVRLHEGVNQLAFLLVLGAILLLIWGLKEFDRARGRG